MTHGIFVVSAARSAIGTFGGSLKDVPLTQLAATVVREAIRRSGAPPDRIGHVVMGNVIATEPRDAYLARVAAVEAGVAPEASAYHVNLLCGSGLHAILLAAQTLRSGDAQIAVGGGAESMSRAPYLAPAARWGARMGDTPLVDFLSNALHDPFYNIHMGVTAENVAAQEGITRHMQDQLAVESHRRAAHAIADGRFASQIVAVDIATRKGPLTFDTDEHVKAGTSMDTLAKMKPAFKPDGTVTAGNASGLNDGAAAVVLATEAAVKAHNLAPIARLVSHGYAGLDPRIMGMGPVPASHIALQRAGLTVRDLDVIEANEAFAAQACAVTRALDLDPAKVNPNGSGIALGHPLGATGAIITTKALYELQRTRGRYALVTMCIGGGQGIAAIFERMA